jgi:hypothetical protein
LLARESEEEEGFEKENEVLALVKKRRVVLDNSSEEEDQFNLVNNVLDVNLESDVEDPKAGGEDDEAEGVMEELEIGTSEEEDQEIGKGDLFEGEEVSVNACNENILMFFFRS